MHSPHHHHTTDRETDRIAAPENEESLSMMVIDIRTNGTVEAMHRENVIDLGELGPQEIVRATDIRFDTDTQTWGIWPREYTSSLARVADREDGFYPPPCQHADGLPSYEFARQVEVSWLEACRLRDLEPTSEEGLDVLQRQRAELESRRATPRPAP